MATDRQTVTYIPQTPQLRRVAILPTGDWADVVSGDEVTLMHLTDKQYSYLRDGHVLALADSNPTQQGAIEAMRQALAALDAMGRGQASAKQRVEAKHALRRALGWRAA